MNNVRRKSVRDAIFHLEQSISIVETIYDTEQDIVDNYPENLQGTDRYEQMENTVDCLSDALDSLRDASDKLLEAIA